MVGHVIVLIAVLTCLRLGWWQWDVSQRPAGTIQNLGYAILWPVFAGSFIYMWLRFLQLESERVEAEIYVTDGLSEELAGPADSRTMSQRLVDDVDRAPTVRRPRTTRRRGPAYTVGVGIVHDDADDAELTAYNRALAALAEQDENRAD